MELCTATQAHIHPDTTSRTHLRRFSRTDTEISTRCPVRWRSPHMTGENQISQPKFLCLEYLSYFSLVWASSALGLSLGCESRGVPSQLVRRCFWCCLSPCLLISDRTTHTHTTDQTASVNLQTPNHTKPSFVPRKNTHKTLRELQPLLETELSVITVFLFNFFIIIFLSIERSASFSIMLRQCFDAFTN